MGGNVLLGVLEGQGEAPGGEGGRVGPGAFERGRGGNEEGQLEACGRDKVKSRS